MMKSPIRRRVAQAFDVELRQAPGLSAANKAIAALILVSTLLVILETESAIHEPNRMAFLWSERSILILFLAEYLLRLWSCLENPRFRSRWAYAVTPVAVIDLLVISTMVFSFLGLEGSILPLLRLVRLTRIAKLGKYSKALENIGQAIAERRSEQLVSLFIAFGLLLGSASALYLIEGELQPEAFGSIPRAMWWSVATLTTVGYGDIIPITPLGKFFASLTALTGIGLIAMPAGILASAFSAAMQKKNRLRNRD